MKCLIFVILAIVTFYVGGIYRDSAIMTLFVCEGVVFFVMLITAEIMKFGIKCYFKEGRIYITKDRNFKIAPCFENKGILPVFKFTFKYRYFYKNKRENKALKISSAVNKKSKVLPKINVRGKYCGIMKVNIYSVKAADYLGIFKAGCRCKAESEILVFPREKKISFVPLGEALKGKGDRGEKEGAKGGENSMEIHQLKPYEWGEPVKNIHWNLFAKTDEIYCKEYSEREDSNIIVYLDLRKIDRDNLEMTDGFYEICQALMLGVLESFGSCEVCFIKGNEIYSRNFNDREDLKDIMTELYYAEKTEKFSGNIFDGDKNVIMLNCDLELFFNGKKLYGYSSENCTEEILKNEIAI